MTRTRNIDADPIERRDRDEEQQPPLTPKDEEYWVRERGVKGGDWRTPSVVRRKKVRPAKTQIGGAS
jgi:hypothetical protein